jgi:O-methyltransferase
MIAHLYLDTLKKALIDLNRCDGYYHKPIFNLGNYQLSRIKKVDREKRINGEDWPQDAESMIGLKRMDNIQFLIDEIIRNHIPGDLLEAGVWRGGASIFMKANLVVHGSDKCLFVCDSFAGLPVPTHEQDAGDIHHTHKQLAISLQEVKNNFHKYGLLYTTPRTYFIKGLFKDTMPTLKPNKFSLIRLDGDMYESTMDVLKNLYSSLSPGGYVIVDDWCLKPCRQAVMDFNKSIGINPKYIPIDNTAVYFQK